MHHRDEGRRLPLSQFQRHEFRNRHLRRQDWRQQSSSEGKLLYHLRRQEQQLITRFRRKYSNMQSAKSMLDSSRRWHVESHDYAPLGGEAHRDVGLINVSCVEIG
jgi:hypothetical protein